MKLSVILVLPYVSKFLVTYFASGIEHGSRTVKKKRLMIIGKSIRKNAKRGSDGVSELKKQNEG